MSRAVFLEEALLGSRFFIYALYRLRFFAANAGFGLFFHLVEFKLLVDFMGKAQIGLFFVIKVTSLMMGAFWWGALESMREKVRSLYRSQKMFLVPKLLETWLPAGVTLAALVVFVDLLWFSLYTLRHGGITPYSLLIFGFWLRLGLTFFVRTFHSGVYAIRRIYRPLKAIFFVEAITPILAYGLKPLIGAWAFPIAFIVSGFAGLAVSLYYIRRVYHYFKFLPVKFWPSFYQLRKFRSQIDRSFVWSGLAFSTMRSESLIVLLLFLPLLGKADDNSSYLLFYMITPMLQACRDWAIMFYFDFKKLEVDFYKNLKMHFELQLEYFSIVMATCTWILALLLARLFELEISRFTGVSLGVFFLAQSLLSYHQVRGFSFRDYVRVFQSSLAMLVGFIVVKTLIPGAAINIFFSIPLLCGLWIALKAHQKNYDEGVASIPFPIWLTKLVKRRKSVSVGYAKPEEGTPLYKRLQCVRRLKRSLRNAGEVSLLPNGHLVWFENSPPKSKLSTQQLINIGAGILDEVQMTEQEPAATSLQAAVESNYFGPFLREAWIKEQVPNDQNELVGNFKKKFPKAFCLDTSSFTSRLRSHYNHEVVRQITGQALSEARWSCQKADRGPFDVSIFARDGILQYIFIVDKKEPRKKRDDWRYYLRRLQVVSALEQPS